jgi:hypothetical protein
MTDDDGDDLLDQLSRRSAMANAGVRVVAIAGRDASASREIAEGIATLLAERGRESEVVVIEPFDGRGDALTRGIAGSSLPLLLVTTAEEPWTAAHLDPLLASIERADHVLGRRRVGLLGRLGRKLSAFRWRLLFAVPAVDVHTPCRLHRLAKLATITPQSASSFLDVEVLAKATFLHHLIDEVAVPALGSHEARSFGDDFRTVFSHPIFQRPPEPASGPAEELQGEQEGPQGPGGQDEQGHPDDLVSDPRAEEDHGPQGVEQVGQGQHVDQDTDRPLEAIGREEQAGEDPHRQHHEVHEAADSLGRLRPAGNQQADPGERERPDDLQQHDQP